MHCNNGLNNKIVESLVENKVAQETGDLKYLQDSMYDFVSTLKEIILGEYSPEFFNKYVDEALKLHGSNLDEFLKIPKMGLELRQALNSIDEAIDISNQEFRDNLVLLLDKFQTTLDNMEYEARSPYDVAVKYGFKGTEEEWVANILSDTKLLNNLKDDVLKVSDYINTIPSIVNDAINNTAVEGGILADTFVTMTKKSPKAAARNLREINSESLSVKDFGAKGDGVTDDRKAIQDALDYGASIGGAELFFPVGTYLLNSLSELDEPGRHLQTILIPRSNVNLRGVKGQSILKIGTGLLTDTTRNFYMFKNGNEYVNNVYIKELKFDGSGAEIPAIGRYDNQRCMSIGRFNNIYIGHCDFVNWGGSHVFHMGMNTEKTGKWMTIEHNHFENLGQDNEGSLNNDHSTVYISAENVSVLYNTFEGVDNLSNKTAIECHSSNAMIKGNKVKNYNIGIIIAATVKHVNNVIIDSNSIISLIPISIWGYGRYQGYDVTNLRIQGNYLNKYKATSSSGVIQLLHPSSKSITGPVHITNNFIESDSIDEISKANTGWGISLTYTDELYINNNIFKDLPGPVLKINSNTAFYDVPSTEPTASVNFSFTNNKVIDCCSKGIPGFTYLIDTVTNGSVNIGSIEIVGNEFTKGAATTGFFCSNPLDKLVFKGNTFDVDTLTKEIDCMDVAVTQTEITQISYLARNERPNTLGSLGCSYYDVNKRTVYKPNSITPSIRWYATIYADAPPSTGSFFVGDKVINTLLTETSPTEWVCVKSGAPGTWRALNAM